MSINAIPTTCPQCAGRSIIYDGRKRQSGHQYCLFRWDSRVNDALPSPPDLLAVVRDALIATIGGHNECQYCSAHLYAAVPWFEGDHAAHCWVPKALDAYTRATS